MRVCVYVCVCDLHAGGQDDHLSSGVHDLALLCVAMVLQRCYHGITLCVCKCMCVCVCVCVCLEDGHAITSHEHLLDVIDDQFVHT
jgi:hypothetical protein